MIRTIEHYMSLKECYPDCILWYQNLSQINAYGADAIKTAEMLELPITISMYGVEMTSFYIAYLHYNIDLIPKGTKVVIVRSQNTVEVNNFKLVSQ